MLVGQWSAGPATPCNGRSRSCTTRGGGKGGGRRPSAYLGDVVPSALERSCHGQKSNTHLAPLGHAARCWGGPVRRPAKVGFFLGAVGGKLAIFGPSAAGAIARRRRFRGKKVLEKPHSTSKSHDRLGLFRRPASKKIRAGKARGEMPVYGLEPEKSVKDSEHRIQGGGQRRWQQKEPERGGGGGRPRRSRPLPTTQDRPGPGQRPRPPCPHPMGEKYGLAVEGRWGGSRCRGGGGEEKMAWQWKLNKNSMRRRVQRFSVTWDQMAIGRQPSKAAASC